MESFRSDAEPVSVFDDDGPTKEATQPVTDRDAAETAQECERHSRDWLETPCKDKIAREDENPIVRERGAYDAEHQQAEQGQVSVVDYQLKGSFHVSALHARDSAGNVKGYLGFAVGEESWEAAIFSEALRGSCVT